MILNNDVKLFGKDPIKGFTLIELSIVMVIIGLIISGILAGQEMINGASVRATVSQIYKYNSAINTFHTKYNSLPGDFATATNYLNGADIVNGNGDGLIGGVVGAATNLAVSASGVTIGTSPENSGFWRHLQVESLVEGSYMQVSTGTYVINSNFPATRVNSGIGILAYANTTDSSNYYHLGLSSATTGTPAVTNLFSPSLSYDLDNKMDDGNPTTGIVVARGSSAGGGVEGQPSVNGSATISTTPGCVIGTVYALGVPATPAGSYLYNTGLPTSSIQCQLRIRIN